MKKLIPLILTAAMTLTLAACTAAPDPAPLATPHAGADGSGRSPHAGAAGSGRSPHARPCRRFLHPEKLQRLL